MPQDNNIKELIINQLTKEQYRELKDNNQLSNTELYIISDNAYYTEEELSILLNAKQNKLTAGDGVTIENDIITINLDDFYTSIAIDELLSKKADISEAGNNFDYTDNILTLQNIYGEELSSIKVVSMPELDNVTVNLNNSNQLQAIGEITRNGIPKYTWVGTQEEYEQAKTNGVINEFTQCIITDSSAEIVTPVVQFEAPTKLSDLANDMSFISGVELENVKTDLETKIENRVDDDDLVHRTGSETIDGFKQFKEKIVIENDSNKGRIAHKATNSSLEDGYIEFGDNTLIFGKQNVEGELFDEKRSIFHEGNLIAGNNVIITKEDDKYKINSELTGTADADLSNLSITGEAKLNNLVATKAEISVTANTDLSNLTTTGNNKFNAKVNKAGDTMTGNLNINKAGGIVGITGTGYKGIITKSTDIDYTLTDQVSLQGARILSQDKNGQWFGYFQNGIGSGGNVFTNMSARRIIDGTAKECNIGCSVSKTGVIYTNAPTPATGDNSTKIATTAYVNNQINNKIKAYITETYSNGTSWYRVYSDGWCEQGGRTQCASTNSQTLTFIKSFSNTNYNIQTIMDISGSTGSYNEDAFIGARDTASVTIHCKDGNGKASGTSIYFYWYACGYIK